MIASSIVYCTQMHPFHSSLIVVHHRSIVWYYITLVYGQNGSTPSDGSNGTVRYLPCPMDDQCCETRISSQRTLQARGIFQANYQRDNVITSTCRYRPHRTEAYAVLDHPRPLKLSSESNSIKDGAAVGTKKRSVG